MINKLMPQYFRLGEFVANLHIKGILHPDLKLDNIGYDDDLNIKLLDFADVIFLKFPEDLKNENIDKLTKSFFPLIRNISFDDLSWFRCGYIYRGGNISDFIFNNSINNGLCSFNYIDIEEEIGGFSVCLSEDDFNLAMEWKDIDFNIINSRFLSLSQFEDLPVRNNLAHGNKYYFNLYYLLNYYNIFTEKDDNVNRNIIIFNMGITAYNHKKFIVTYGLLQKFNNNYKKCGNNKILEEYVVVYNNVLNEIEKKVTNYKTTIKKSIEYDIPQLLWILDNIEMQNNG